MTARDDAFDQLQLQKSVDPHLEAVDPFGDLRKLARRVCLIRRDAGSESTGFLVGPDLMLTAAHTLRGTAGIFADPDEVTILFDQFLWNEDAQTVAYGDQCRLRHIPFTRQPDVVASSIIVDAKCRKKMGDGDNGLDYVLVRLDRPIGLSFLPFSHRIRGWNDCHIAKVPVPAPDGMVTVVQHPLGGIQQFADGVILRPKKGDPPDRFRYHTMTLNGSSGAPIVDERRRVVGLHVEERLDGKKAVQFGVSFQTIFKDLRKQGVVLPPFRLTAPVMESLFGTSRVEKMRKPGSVWRGDRLFDDIHVQHLADAYN